MRKRDEWIERVRLTEQEYEIAALAVSLLADRTRTDPNILPGRVRPRDVTRMAATVEATYFVRLFAVFETGVREAWREALGRDTQPPMRDLLDGVASARDVPPPIHAAAHQVREFRNTLVHEQAETPGTTVTIGEGRRHLTRFFSHLPPDW